MATFMLGTLHFKETKKLRTKDCRYVLGWKCTKNEIKLNNFLGECYLFVLVFCLRVLLHGLAHMRRKLVRQENNISHEHIAQGTCDWLLRGCFLSLWGGTRLIEIAGQVAADMTQ